jgi:hypothetical protein
MIALGQSTTQTVTVTLNAAVALKTITLGPNVTEYTLGTVTGCTVDGTTVNVSGSVCSIPVTYTPKALGSPLAASTARGAPLQVTDVESGNPVVYSFGLLGGATGPIMEFSPATITLVAGVPATGYAAGDNGLGSTTGGYGGTGGPATSATFNFTTYTGTEDELPRQPMAVDSAGNIFVYDDGNNIIRRIDAVTTNVTTVAGVADATPYTYSGDGGPATSAGIGGLVAMTLDAADNIYFSNYGTAAGDGSYIIRRVDGGSGIITGVAGQNFSDTEFGDTLCPDVGQDTTWEPTCGDGGPAATAFIYQPTALAIDAAGNIYILQYSGNIRKIDAATGIITTVVASVGPGANELFGMAFGADGFLYVGFDDPTISTLSELVAKIDPSSGTQTVVMGSATAQPSPTTCIQSGSPGTNWWLDFGDANNPGLSADGAGNVYGGTYDCSAGTSLSGYVGEFRYNVTSGLAYAWNFGQNVFGGGGGQNGVFESWGNLYGIYPAYAVGDGAGNIYFMTNNQIAKLSGSQGALNGFGSRIDFQTAPAGYTCSTSGSDCETAVISNIGNAPLTTSLTLDPNWIYLNTGDSSACTGGSLAPGEFCNLDLEFSPIEVGTIDGNLTLTDNATTQEDGVQNLALVGTGVAAALANLAPTTWNFNTVADGNSATKTFVLSNPGTAALDIYFIEVSPTTPQEFSETNTCGTSLGAGDSCNIVVTFTPTATSGTFTNTLTVEESVGSGTLTASLSGTAGPAAAPAATLTPIAFGGLIKGTTSAPMTATLTNTGTAELTITGVTVTGTNAADFAITTGTNACAASLAAGDSCFIYATFTPSLVGGETATLNVADNAPSSPQTASLTGSGVAFVSNVGTAQPAQSIGVFFTAAGTISSTQTFTRGASSLDYNTATGGTCADGTAYTLGQFCTVNIVFTPKYAGARNGAVLLSDSSGNILGTTYLPGIGNGPQLAYTTGATTASYTTSSGEPYGLAEIAMDESGNIYGSDGNNDLIEIPFSGSAYGSPKVLLANLSYSPIVAIDGVGSLIYTQNSTLMKLPWNGAAFGQPSTLIDLGANYSLAFNRSNTIAVDGYGNIFFVDDISGAVYEIPLVNGTYSASQITQLPFTDTGANTQNNINYNSLAFDVAGNLYAGEQSGDLTVERVLKLPRSGSGWGTQVVVASGLANPQSIAVDAAGNVAIANNYLYNTTDNEPEGNPYTYKVVFIPWNGTTYGAPQILPIDITYDLYSLAMNSQGNIFVGTATSGGTSILELNRSVAPSLTFAATPVGSTSSDSPKTVPILNIGNAALTISGTTPDPTYPTSFPENTADSNLCGASATLAPGASCDVSVDFKPTTSGSLTGNVVMTDNNLNVSGATQNIGLTGDGVGSLPPTATLTGISFGSEVDGSTTAAMSATLTNTSTTTALTISDVTITGANARDFALATGTNACGGSLAANTSCLIYATFKPSLVGPESATLNVADNATGSPQTAPLSGTGVAQTITATLTAISFGGEVEGSTSAAMTSTLTNTSPTASLTITGMSITGTNAADFAMTTGTNACGTSLAANTSCLIYATFKPSLVGPESATLSVADNATGSPQTAALTGTGTAASPTATLTGIAFGNVTEGTTSAAMSATLTNTSTTTALTISSVTITGTNGDDFTKATGTGACGSSLAANTSCNIYATFTPSLVGAESATLGVNDNATGSPQTAALTGTGTAPLVPVASLSPTTLAFGNQAVNTTSAAMTTTLSNTGTGPLSISSIYLNEPSEDDGVVKGPHAQAITISSSPDYSATTTCGATLAAGATCTISVTFTPESTGSLPGTLSVSDNAAGSPQTASLTGTGYTGGNFTVASPTPPQTVKPGGSAQYTINVSVTPNGDIFNNPVTLSASGLPQGASAAFSPVTVTPGTGTATSTMTVHTSSANAMLAPFKDGSKWPIPSSLALVFGGAWALFRRKHRERFARVVSLALLLGAMGAATMGLMGCGAGFAQVQPKTYTITVTGTSGEQTQTTTVQLTVE